MSDTTKKRWQVEVYTAKDEDTPQIFSGDTLIHLREQVYAWLMASQPDYIRSASTHQKREGYKRGEMVWMQPSIDASSAQVYEDFCLNGLLIQEGPEYDRPGFADGKFQLAEVRTVLEVEQSSKVNLLLRRGWHLIGLIDQQGAGAYVLGHTEPDAF